MKLQKLIIVWVAMLLFFVTGCANGIGNEAQKIEVQKRISDENQFADYKEITNSEQVEGVKKILDNADWENAKVYMVHPSDYRFVFQYKNPEIEAKAVLYELWISPNKDKVELVKDALSKYSQLNEEDSAILFEILTGKKLSDLE
ncbi:hypothetical protein [Cytobacillus praedii]|uniref:hypothetical protein n=1 Tax=Cytobacillus praedii TaxID=1742358 RepID=UPI002E2464A3|nr:hypothetical protein [Cytobacillus praedii]